MSLPAGLVDVAVAARFVALDGPEQRQALHAQPEDLRLGVGEAGLYIVSGEGLDRHAFNL